MRLCRTPAGIARIDGDDVAVLDLPHADLAELLADQSSPSDARVIDRRPVADTELLAPIVQPSTVVIVGYNYKAHIAETGADTPSSPPFVALPAGHGVTTRWNGEIVLPPDADTMVDYEGELGIVIGAPAADVMAADAWDVVGGLIALNDVSARDVQRRAMQSGDHSSGIGKLFPTFKPLGGWMVTADEFRHGQVDLELETFVNGERRQHGRTGDLLFGVPDLVEAISASHALEPGDLICTGTPGGVGHPTGDFLAPGDVVEVRIERLGSLRNEVVNRD